MIDHEHAIDLIIDRCLSYFNDPAHDPEGYLHIELGRDYIHDHEILADVTTGIVARRILIILFHVTDELNWFVAYATFDDDRLVNLAIDIDTYIDTILDTTHATLEDLDEPEHHAH